MVQFHPVPPPRSNATQRFVDEKARQAILLLNAARARAKHEQVNHLVKPLPPVRAVAYLLRSEAERCAVRLATELLTRMEREPRSPERSQQLHSTYEACRGIFPREAAALQLVLEADRVAAGGTMAGPTKSQR
jgi:hypothetical protein